MKVILYSLSLVISSFIWCDTKNESSYYHNINIANRNIYNNDFESAEYSFDEAFTKIDLPRYLDVVKLLYCRKKNKSTKSNFDFIDLIVDQKKVNPKQFKFEQRAILNNVDIEYLDRKEYKIFNSQFKSDILAVLEEDRIIRDCSGCDLLKNNIKRNECIGRNFNARDSLDSINAKRFIELVDSKVFPTEDNLGYFVNTHNSLTTVDSIVFTLGSRFVLTSFQDRILAIYKMALTNNQITPEVYSAFYDFYLFNTNQYQSSESYLSTTVDMVRRNPYEPFVAFSPLLLDSINHNRLAIGLDSFYIAQKQVVCSRYCPIDTDYRISIQNFAQFKERSEGIVKAMLALDGKALSEFRLDVSRILEECQCDQKSL